MISKNIVLLILLLFIIIISLTFYIFYNYNERYTEKEIKKAINDISNTKNIKNVPYTLSTGLLIDSIIIKNILKDKENSYNINYEEYNYKNNKNYNDSYLFVNLDITNFDRLIKDKLSPNNIICKTKQTYEILNLKLKNKKIIYSGFTSLDRYNPYVIKDYKSFIHNVGKSPYKGTKNVINVWKSNPHFPTLTIICRNKKVLNGDDIKNVKNIKLVSNYLSEKELENEINKNGIHICPSNNEGFGHYINEAMSAKSVVLLTNAPPMNEFYGIPIDIRYKSLINNGWCPYYEIDEKHLEKIVNNIINMNDNDIKSLEKIGNTSRELYLSNDLNFKNRIKNIFI